VATAIAIALAVALVALEVTSRAVRRFWDGHALTADTVAGVLVVGLTVLIVDQLLMRRQFIQRSREIAVKAGIVLAQARRSVEPVRSVREGGGDRSAAADEFRTYVLMLLVSAPVLIDSPVARRFLEKAQRLAGELGSILTPSAVASSIGIGLPGGLEEAIEGLRAAAAPLLASLSSDELAAVTDFSG
jgi:hypothetical protein